MSHGLLRLMVSRGSIEGVAWEHKGEPNTYISITPLIDEPETPVKRIYLVCFIYYKIY